MIIKWIIEEWIGKGNAIAGKGYWTELLDGSFMSESTAKATLHRLDQQQRTVRLVKVTRQIVLV